MVSFLSAKGPGWEGAAFISPSHSPPPAPEPAKPRTGCLRARRPRQGRVQSHLYLAGREDQQVAGLQGEGLAPAAPKVAGRADQGGPGLGAGERWDPCSWSSGPRMLRAPAGGAPRSSGSWTFMASKCFRTTGQSPSVPFLSLLPSPLSWCLFSSPASHTPARVFPATWVLLCVSSLRAVGPHPNPPPLLVPCPLELLRAPLFPS